MLRPSESFLYALSNPHMPGLLKIGFTTGCPFERAKELSVERLLEARIMRLLPRVA